METVTPEDLNKQVSEIAAFLKKKFPKEFKPGKQVEEEEIESNTGVGEASEVEESTEDSESNSEPVVEDDAPTTVAEPKAKKK